MTTIIHRSRTVSTLTSVLLAAALSGSLLACAMDTPAAPTYGVDAGNGKTDDPNQDDTAVATSIELSASAIELETGATTTVMAWLLDQNGDRMQSVGATAWQSSDEAIVTVDESGTVTAVAEGTATVTATVDGISGSLTATIAAGENQTPITCDADGVPPTAPQYEPCDDIYQGADVWRCVVLADGEEFAGTQASQVCRDYGDGPKWYIGNLNPTNCCACTGGYSDACSCGTWQWDCF